MVIAATSRIEEHGGGKCHQLTHETQLLVLKLGLNVGQNFSLFFFMNEILVISLSDI
jgi:hypothetical protein